ncbi:MAG: vWA domain-containing protein [Candidatus Hodarchaeales archaeon]|jgi:hypothetical protein
MTQPSRIVSNNRDKEDNKEFFTPEIVKEAWNFAIADLMYPPLPDPEIIEDGEGSGWILEDKWQIQVNNFYKPKGLVSTEKISFLRSLLHHEAYHWILIPYDKITSAILVERAMKPLDNNVELARMVVNIVADAIIEYHLASDFFDMQEKRLQITIDHAFEVANGKPTLLWQVIVCCICSVTGHEKLLDNINLEQDAIQMGKELVRILKNLDDETRWPLMVQKASILLKPLLESFLTVNDAKRTRVGKQRSNSGVHLELPEEFEISFPGITELKTREDIGKKGTWGRKGSKSEGSEIEKTARELEKIYKSFGKFSAGLIGSGIVDNSYEAMRYFYRSKARKFLDLRSETPRDRGIVPRNVIKWTLEDPVEEIDISLSAGFGNRLIPGINTFKWQTEYGVELKKQATYPDLLIVIDSSGSMTRSKSFLRGSFDLSVLAAFSAIQTALAAGVKQFNAINFSTGIRDSGWTNNVNKIEDAILAYQGGGTVLPVKRIKKRINEHSNTSRAGVFVLIFTDFGLANWGPVKKLLTSSRPENVFKMFYISTSRRVHKNIDYLSEKGIEIFVVNKTKDLVNLAEKEVKKVYKI